MFWFKETNPIIKSQMFVYFKNQWLNLDYVYLCVFCVYRITSCLSVYSFMNVCMCTILSLFFFSGGRVNGLVMSQAASSEKAKAGVSLVSWCFLPLICPRVCWKGWHELSLCSPSLHTHLKKSSHTPQGSWVKERDIQTIQGCTFVCTAVAFTHEAIQEDTWTELRVRVCAETDTCTDKSEGPQVPACKKK